MLKVSERINSKEELVDWIKYENEKYSAGGGVYAKYSPLLNQIFKKTPDNSSKDRVLFK